MKTMLRIGLGVLVLNCLCLDSHAQEKKGPDRPIAGALGPRPAGGVERLFGVLTEEQRASFRRAMEGEREKMRALEQQLGEARRDLIEAVLVDQFDESAVRKKLNAVMAIDSDATMIRLKAISKLDPPVSAEQLERLRNAAGGKSAQSEPRKQRPDVPRDENGLPLKKN